MNCFLCVASTIGVITTLFAPDPIFYKLSVTLAVIVLIYQYVYKIDYRINFLVFLCFLALLPFPVMINKTRFADRLAVIGFLFFSTGLAKMFLQEFTNQLILIDPIVNLQRKIQLYTKRYSKILFPKKTKHKFIVLFLLLLLISPIYFFQNAYNALREYKNKNNSQINAPTINRVEPYIAYPGIKVVLLGFNFGQTKASEVKLMHKNTEITPDSWSENKIIFTVPKDWIIGDNDITIEKRIYNGREEKVLSQTVTIKVISKPKTIQENAEFFNQLKQLQRETLRINNLSHDKPK